MKFSDLPSPISHLRALLCALCALCVFALIPTAQAQQKITASITVTNLTLNGLTFTVNGNTRTFTNNVVTSSTQVLTNSDVTGSGSKTNLLDQIRGTPFVQVTISDTGSNSFSLVGNANLAMSVSASGAYASISYSTQTVSQVIALQGPISALPTALARSNNASAIVGAANAPENTNKISQITTAASELMGLTNGQTISGVKAFTNALGQWFGVISNSPGISGTIIALTGGLLTSTTITNAQSISGNIGLLHDGVISNTTAVWVSGGATNAIIDSSGVGLFNLFLGLTTSGHSVWGYGDVLFNDSLFFYVTPHGTNSPILIYGVNTNLFTFTVPVSIPSLTVSSNLTISGNSSVTGNSTITSNLTVSGNFSPLGVTTNITAIGTNNFLANSDIAFTRKAVTSLANGNNAAVPIGTNVFIEVSGPSAAFTINGIANGRDGKLIVLLNQSGQVMTMANESGTDPVAANRIRTLTGADLATAANSICTLIYSGSAGRWILLNAGTVTTVTNVNATQITGSITASQIYTPITQTNFVLNQLYTNSSGGGISLHALASLTTAAVSGSSELDLMVAQTGSTFTLIDGPKLITSISAVTGAMQFGINGSVQTNGIYYFTNSSAGAGDSSSIVSGSGQVTGL